MLLMGFAGAYKTAFVINNLGVDHSIGSRADPPWLNDSFAVQDKGRIEVYDDGRYILVNARVYYAMIYKAYPEQIKAAWRRHFHGDFETDILGHYSKLEPPNVSVDLNIRDAFEKKRGCVLAPDETCIK